MTWRFYVVLVYMVLEPQKVTMNVTMSPASYLISNDKDKLDIDLIHQYLSAVSYWAKGRNLAQVKTTLEASICFGVYLGEKQVGFARVLSDKVTLAYLADVFILPEHQGQGLGKRLIRTVLEHEDFQTVSWLLKTKDAQELYKKFGFEILESPNRFMVRAKAV